MKPLWSFKTVGTTCPTTHCHNPVDLNLKQYCCQELHSSLFIQLYFVPVVCWHSQILCQVSADIRKFCGARCLLTFPNFVPGVCWHSQILCQVSADIPKFCLFIPPHYMNIKWHFFVTQCYIFWHCLKRFCHSNIFQQTSFCSLNWKYRCSKTLIFRSCISPFFFFWFYTLLFGLGQVPKRMSYPRFYAIFSWSAARTKNQGFTFYVTGWTLVVNHFTF
jgi:hypothetical protein